MPLKNKRCQHIFFIFVCVILSPGNLSQAQQPDSSPAPPNAPTQATEKKNFFSRWADFYRQDWSPTTASSPAPPRRGLPSPLDSPPFPNSDWSYGGSPVIGEP